MIKWVDLVLLNLLLFKCLKKVTFNLEFYNYFIFQVCDGKIDCDNAADEKGCPGRYFCDTNGTSWVDIGLVCDGYADCPNGDDECKGCLDSSEVSSDELMIRYKSIRVLIMAESVMIIVLNAMAARTIFRTNIYIYGSDRITLLSLCFYDGGWSKALLALLAPLKVWHLTKFWDDRG